MTTAAVGHEVPGAPAGPARSFRNPARNGPAGPGRAQRAFGALAPLVVVLAIGGLGYQAIAAETDRRAHPAPGRLVDAGGLRLHVRISGEPAPDRPTVVLEAGPGRHVVQLGVDPAGAGAGDARRQLRPRRTRLERVERRAPRRPHAGPPAPHGAEERGRGGALCGRRALARRPVRAGIRRSVRGRGGGDGAARLVPPGPVGTVPRRRRGRACARPAC